MSTDAKITKDLIQILEDGKEGFATAASRLTESNRADLSATFQKFSTQREGFATELKLLAEQYGDEIDKSGTVTGTLHRGWMAVKDALAGNEPDGVIDAAEQGEDHAVAAYDAALADQEMSAGLRTVVQRQYVEVKAAHDVVRDLKLGRN